MPASSVLAQQSEEADAANLRVNLQNDTPVMGDFTVGPTRHVFALQPGEERSTEIQLTNRTGGEAIFHLSAEDFASNEEGEGSPRFFEPSLDGPYPARSWLIPEVNTVRLQHGERAFIRIKIVVPNDAEPGDHQTALIITREGDTRSEGGFQIVPRVASLFILSVAGDIVRDGDIEELWPRRYFNWFLPVYLHAKARNDGNVYMAPQGTVTIRNIFGIVVDELLIEDWIVLRNSTREFNLNWQPKFALGRYSVETNLSAFDGTPLTQRTTSFWVIPLLPVLLLLLLIFLVTLATQYFMERFEIRRKRS